MEPVRPDYGGPCVANVVRALRSGEPWVPQAVAGARSVVLLVVDGLGWEMIRDHSDALPNLGGMDGGPISTVVPSTTTAALTSITTGLSPAEHGIVGYRMLLGPEVFNVLRWAGASARSLPSPETFQPRAAFGGEPVPVVTKAEFESTGFTAIHLRGSSFVGWHATSSIPGQCRRLVAEGERFVYAYYGNADIVFHMHGLHDELFVAELRFVDRLVGDLLDALPSSVALVVTADHGHVHIEGKVTTDEVDPLVSARSGESRFRYLHARPGASGELASAASELYGDRAWVFERERLIDEGWLGPRPPSAEVRRRVGDVILAARAPVAFLDPTNAGEARLLSGHGSLTAEEMLVPLLGARGTA